MDYFKDDYLIIVDESHITIPQIRGMYAGTSREKSTLVDYGSVCRRRRTTGRLILRNLRARSIRCCSYRRHQNVYEDEHELLRTEQIIRPTGLLDPEVVVRPVEGQIDDLIGEVNKKSKTIIRC